MKKLFKKFLVIIQIVFLFIIGFKIYKKADKSKLNKIKKKNKEIQDEKDEIIKREKEIQLSIKKRKRAWRRRLL